MSLFPPIADYGFLSNCEQSCLVAPDGAVEWLCLPRPDSPSVFGALLDRAAGLFRFGPTNTHVPQHRRYVPGTMVLETTWQTPTGWMTVQDFLAIGPLQHEGRRPDYHRAPADFGAVGALVRIATCISGRVEAVVNCAPLFNYGAVGGTWNYKGDGYDAMTIAPHEGDLQLKVSGTIPLGVMGARCYGRTTLAEGQSAFVALSWGGDHVPATPGRGLQRAEHHGRFLARLAELGQDPGPSVEALPGPQRPDPERAQLRPHRRDHGRLDDLAAGNARRGAELGLPVHLDQGLGVHAPFPVPAGFRLGSARVLGIRRRRGQRG